MIRFVQNEDTEQIRDIYNYYIENTSITFEEEKISSSEMQSRIMNVTASLPWLVYEENNRIFGYAYASKWKGRCAYRFSVETSVYMKNDCLGKGTGTMLYERLIDELRTRNVHAVIGGVALPNERSRKLHEKLGFSKVAHFPEVGYKFGQWIDVGYWQLNLC